MKINVKIPVNSTKLRVLSAFMAFMIFSLTFTQAFVGMSTRAGAVTVSTGTKFSDYMVKGRTGSTTHDGYSVSNGNVNSSTLLTNEGANATFEYEYTGKTKSTKISLYDYLSDNEISGGTPTSYYTAYGCEPFDQFNTAISEHSYETITNTTTCQASDNITIVFTSGTINSNVHVYLWDTDGGSNNAWPGTAMDYDSANNRWTYTFSRTDANSGRYLGFTPLHVIFNNGNSGTGNQSSTIDIQLTKGYTYHFNSQACYDDIVMIYDSGINRGNDICLHYWKDTNNSTVWPGKPMTRVDDGTHFSYTCTVNENFTPTNYLITRSNGTKITEADMSFPSLKRGYTYIFTPRSEDGTTNILSEYCSLDSAEAFTYTTSYNSDRYDIPLYFGCYYRNSQNASAYQTNNDTKPAGQTFGSNILTAGGPYYNFFWQANLGMKSTGDGSGNNSVTVRGHAAVQGLVDDKLTTDSAPTTADPDGKLRQNGVELPYFSTDFETAHPTMMNIIDNNGAGIDFPFYEIKANANTVRGTVTDSSAEARFYQFNSAESNLQLKGTANNWYFVESDLQITSNNNNAGFFPFNSENSISGGRIAINNNVGFGTKFEMRFKLKEDGQVYPVDSDGNDIKDKGKIHTMFEFIGDDDLWVFIDGNLVLDLGGCHDQTTGLIDFADKKAYANKALNINAAGNNKDDLGASVGVRKLEDTDFTSKINGYDSSTGKYNKNTTHTMTIYYLERGMMDSNLLVRFNFTPESTFSKMKVAEVTDFSKVNAGLKSYTRQAADKDVFKYTVANKGTTNADIAGTSTGILYPTYDQYDRENHYVTEDESESGYNAVESTTLTKTAINTRQVTASNSIFLNISNQTWWAGDNAVIAAWVGKNSADDETRRLYIGKNVAENIYEFSNIPAAANYVKFYRLNPAYTYPNGSAQKPYDDTGITQIWNGPTTDKSIARAKTYWIRSSNGNDVGDPGGNDYVFNEVVYYQNNYTPDTAPDIGGGYKAVANTNYLWEDNFKSLYGDELDSITGMTGKTNANGELYLMYGSGRPYGDGRESSVEFENSFKVHKNASGGNAEVTSMMKVIQSDALYTHTNGTPASLTSTTSRSLNTYYKTSVQLFDRQSNTRELSPNRAADYTTTFPFKHITTDDGTVLQDDTHEYKPVPEYLTVMLTEVFTNEVRVGAISVTKALEYGETGPTQDHVFQLTLTDVMGNGVNVTDYSKITVTGAKAAKLTSGGQFTISGTGTATITGIPVGTGYTVTEVTPGSYFTQSGITNGSGTVYEGSGADSATPDSRNEVTVTNERKTGGLTLSKSLVGEANAQSQDVDNNTPFTLHVTLTAPTGQNVDLQNYFTTQYLDGIKKTGTTPVDYRENAYSENNKTRTIQ